MAPGVCVASFRVFLRSSDLLRFRLTPAACRSFPTAESTTDYRGKGRYCSTQQSQSRQLSSTQPPATPPPPPPPPPVGVGDSKDEVTVKYIQGLPHITVPLPSRNEKCRFALRPVSHKVFNLIEMLKLEDHGVDRAIILNEDGVRIASSCSIESLMDEPFWLQINDKKYKVVPPTRDRFCSEDLDKLGDVRALVGQLYEALHVGEYQIHKEEELVTKLEKLKYDLGPLETVKSELNADAERRSTIYAWVGLGFMSVQFGILARLTWWEYSWDIMEPVTYFVTYGTTMAAYAYWLATKTEYNYDDVKDRHYLISLHSRAKTKKFNVDQYNTLKRQIYDIEYDLRRLRDPLNLQIAPHLDRASHRRMPLPDSTSFGGGSGSSSSGGSGSSISGGSGSDSTGGSGGKGGSGGTGASGGSGAAGIAALASATYRNVVCSTKPRTLLQTVKDFLTSKMKK